MKKCASGNQEIFEHRFCDGIIDCADESDEQGCSCKYNFRNLPLGIDFAHPIHAYYHPFDVTFYDSLKESQPNLQGVSI